ncbi:glycoside hydrolase family 99-like domain-containing protein [Methylolobus aquaticus]
MTMVTTTEQLSAQGHANEQVTPYSVSNPMAAPDDGLSNTKKVIVVLGMHRSGTSVLTRGLLELGVGLGERLVPADQNNPKGYWEDSDICALNERLLEVAGLRWNSFMPSGDLPLNPSQCPDLFIEAVELLSKKTAGHLFWGFKDPRTAPLLTFWTEAFTASGLQPCYVLAVRNPLSVSRSLQTRDGLAPEKSGLLWAQHIRSAVIGSRRSRRVVVDYDLLLACPARELARIANALGLEPVSEEALSESDYCRTFISPGLRHSRHGASMLSTYPLLENLTAPAYQLLLKVARDEADLATVEETTDWLDFLSNVESLTAFSTYVSHLESRLEIALSEAEQLEARLATGERTLLDREGEIKRLHEESDALLAEKCLWEENFKTTRNEKEEVKSQFEQQGQLWDGRFQSLLRSLESRDAKLGRHEEELASLLREMASNAAELGKLNHLLSLTSEERDQLQFAIEKRQRELSSLYASTSWKLSGPLRLAKRRLPSIAAGLGHWLRVIYLVAPLPVSLKLNLKSILFAVLSPLIRHTRAYQAWLLFETKRTNSKVALSKLAPANRKVSSDAYDITSEPEVPLAPSDPAMETEGDRVERSEVSASSDAARDNVAGFEETRSLAASISFHDAGNPWVSIIIPVYNQIDLTVKCLKALSDVGSRYSFEVIVVNDCSTDGTQSIISDIPGLHFLSNAQNVGFTKGCNRGARSARGRYLVFLNNDTIVHPGWLDSLVEAMQQQPSAGLVGSKLIFPNGKLQEAGGMVWSDASGHNFGRNDDPRRPEYNYLKEVDYCSGASIIIERDLFVRLGGFDERYAPAYYEDTDLAFKVRQAGLRVLYQPLSELTHFEGGTAGTDVTVGVKAHQVLNAEKFYEKWKVELSSHPSPSENGKPHRDRYAVAKALVVDVWPTPDKDSGSIDALNLLKTLLAFNYKVTFFPDNTVSHFGHYTTALQGLGVECLYEPYVESLLQFLEETDIEFDVIFLRRASSGGRHLELVRRFQPKSKIIFDTVDLHFVRETRRAELEGSWEVQLAAEATKALELEYVRRADGTIVVSPAEKEALEAEVPGCRVWCVPFSRDIPGRKACFSERTDILFVGGFLHEPNVDAVRYFVQEVWPRVKTRLPDARFLIVGSNIPAEFQRWDCERIVPVGYVKDLAPYMERSRITVAPLRYGAGIKGKVATSLSFGVPVVGTPIAFEGMGCHHQGEVLQAEAPEEFADAVIEAYTQPALWNRLSESGLRLVASLYSHDVGRAKLSEILGYFGKPSVNGYHVSASVDDPAGNGAATGRDSAGVGVLPATRVIAFYLPQFHPIPENDIWWGKGFTEWTNVTRARPLFPGHYQPHLPSDLGFYDLRVPEVREAQVELARQFGVYGFCYYYYWFAGQRLLERPLNEMLTSGSPDFPFCLCWANESWTRRWDGREQHILMEQRHSNTTDVRFIRDVIPAFRDERYIRIGGRPLLLVYRTELLPDPKRTAEVWREECRRAGIGDIFLCRAEAFTRCDPASVGFDAAYEFPPLQADVPELDPREFFGGSHDLERGNFSGKIFPYESLVEGACAQERPPYQRFRGVMVSWDNSARRGNTAYIWQGSTPELYGRWLRNACDEAERVYSRPDERLVFVNAWNEWAEGCHLEPDQRFGRLYLEATWSSLQPRHT